MSESASPTPAASASPTPAASASPTPAPNANDKAAAPPGQQTLSQLVARILDQLSVSAWLPAGVLVFLLLLIGNLQIADGSLQTAVENIADMGIESVVLLLGAVILTTVLTQAFEFEAIRVLEGYWGPGPIASVLADWASRRHLARLERLRERELGVRRKAFPKALLAMHRDVRGEVVTIIDAWLTDGPPPGSPSAGDLQEATSIFTSFMEHAEPSDQRRCRALVMAREQYPPASLILPTRLGNTLRSYEHPLDGTAAGPLQNFVREVYHELPMPLQGEHDQFRSRLDLYCSLVAIFAICGALAGGATATGDTKLGAASAAICWLLAWLTYRAAVASAREYGRVLRAIAGFRNRDS